MPPTDSVFDSFNKLQKITRDLDEHGLVLALAAYAEEALGDLLTAFMLKGDASIDLLKGFNAPLGTFSARTKAAYALGLISVQQHDNLDRLRKMRNEFAHSWEPLSISDQRISAHIAAMHYSPLVTEFPPTPVEKLRAVSAALLTEIRSLTGRIEDAGLSARAIGGNLIPGVSLDHPDRLGVYRDALSQIGDELPASSGERRHYLEAQRDRWLALLDIMRKGASEGDDEAIGGLIALYNKP